MASKGTAGFDFNLHVRCFKQDVDDFYEACKRNGEPDGSTVIRRMMADYTEGGISYNVQHEERQ